MLIMKGTESVSYLVLKIQPGHSSPKTNSVGYVDRLVK